MIKVLVTGGGGFLGRYIIKRLLARGYAVRSLGRSAQPDLTAWGVEAVQGDIADESAVLDAVQGCDAVIHVAAKAGIWGPWEHYYNANVMGTRHVLKACQREGIERLVYTSTPSVVFNGQAFEGADESLPYGENDLCYYAETKAIAEAEVLAAHDPKGLKTTALRPHLIWGIGDNHLIPRIIARAQAGRLRIIGAGQSRVDITHVSNAADAHLQALDALEQGVAGGQAYFLSQGEPVVLWEWINTLLTGLHIAPVKKKLSASWAYKLGGGLEFLYKSLSLRGEPPMTRFLAIELSKNHWFDISAAKKDLNYRVKVSTEVGLQALIQHLHESKTK